jgi:hypothetical protein
MQNFQKLSSTYFKCFHLLSEIYHVVSVKQVQIGAAGISGFQHSMHPVRNPLLETDANLRLSKMLPAAVIKFY